MMEGFAWNYCKINKSRNQYDFTVCIIFFNERGQNMATKIYSVNDVEKLKQAGPGDLVELNPVPGSTPVYIVKNTLDILVYGIVRHEFMHLSGPTGSAKSSVIEAMSLVENFMPVCKARGIEAKGPVRIFPVEMATFESPAELYQRRALKGGATYDEKSILVQSLEKAQAVKANCYTMIWLREMGRVHSSAVQGGLLNLMTKTDIIMPDGSRIDGSGIAWIADSNYQADSDAMHTLVVLDDALKRRFSLNITLGYLPEEQEELVLWNLGKKEGMQESTLDLIPGIVRLGNEVRRQKMEGNLQTIIPPTIYGYLALLRMIDTMPDILFQDAVSATLLGNAAQEDSNVASTVFNGIFGIQSDFDDYDEDVEGMWV
jgi:hypothetical protein